MFDFVRKHTKWALGLLLLLIIPSFVFFGVEGYTSLREAANAAVAEVDGVKITRGEWDNAQQRSIERARQQMPGLDTKLIDTPQARLETLDALVRERVLFAAAQQMHLAPSDARLQRLFASDPQFAGLRNPDGSVNRDLLAMQGMSSEVFAQRLRQDIAMQQVTAGITRSAVAPTSIVNAAADPLLQRREVQFQRFDPATYRDRIKPTDAEVQAYYEANSAQFKAPEQATIEYAVLDLEALPAAADPSEDELRKFYTDNSARFTAPQERRASHILVTVDAAAPAAEKDKAKAKAEELLAQVKQNPAGFADLARRHSQDPGSAAQGGDLGFFGRGAMVKPFEDSVFSMKVGELSGVVQSDFGFHIITVTGIKGGDKKPFDEVKAEISAELRRAAALKRWPELAEQFTNTVYEQPDSLKPAVDKLKLELKTATVSRTPAPGASGALASARLLEAVFGTESLQNKRNTDAVEVGPNRLASARVVQHQPARVLPLADVKEAVRQRVVAQQAQAMAVKEGQARLAALRQAGAAAEALPDSATVSRAQTQGLPRELMDAVLQADAAKLPALTGVDLKDQGFVVLRVKAVLPREPLPGGEEPLRQQYAQAWANAEAEAYLAALKRRFKAEVKPDARRMAETAAAASPTAGTGTR